jgi:hypothetical protein
LEEDSEFKVEEVKKVEKVEKEKKKLSDMLSDFEEEDNESDFEPPKPKVKPQATSKPSNAPLRKIGVKPKLTKDKIKEIDEKIKRICGLKCHECNIDIETHNELHNHFKKRHKNIPRYLICCNKKFLRKSRLLNHFAMKHDEGEDHPCEICGGIFKTRDNLRHHERIAHENHKPKTYVPETLMCQECGKILTSTLSLEGEGLKVF